jgi:hypothetical protein
MTAPPPKLTWPALPPGVTTHPFAARVNETLLTHRLHWANDKQVFRDLLNGFIAVNRFAPDDLVVFTGPGDKWRIVARKSHVPNKRERQYAAARGRGIGRVFK